MTTKLQNLTSVTSSYDPFMNHIDYRGIYAEQRRQPLDIAGHRAYSVVGKRIPEPFTLQLHVQGGHLTEDQKFYGVKRDLGGVKKLLEKKMAEEKVEEQKKVVAPMKKRKKLEDLMRGFFTAELDKRSKDQNSQYLMSQMTDAEKRLYLNREAEKARYMRNLAGSDAAVRQDNATRQATLDYFNIANTAIGQHNPSLLELFGQANAATAGGTVAGSASGGSSTSGMSTPSIISTIMSNNRGSLESLYASSLTDAEDPDMAESHGLVSDLIDAYAQADEPDDVLPDGALEVIAHIENARHPTRMNREETELFRSLVDQVASENNLSPREFVHQVTYSSDRLTAEDARDWSGLFIDELELPDMDDGSTVEEIHPPRFAQNTQRNEAMSGASVRPLLNSDTLAIDDDEVTQLALIQKNTSGLQSFTSHGSIRSPISGKPITSPNGRVFQTLLKSGLVHPDGRWTTTGYERDNERLRGIIEGREGREGTSRSQEQRDSTSRMASEIRSAQKGGEAPERYV